MNASEESTGSQDVTTSAALGTGGTQRPIVVGVDGSPGAVAALRWAAGEAVLRNAPLRVVTAWRLPVMAPYAIPAPLDLDGWRAIAQAELDRTVAAVFGTARPVRLETDVVEGNAARVLLDAAKDAQLLAVGARGHGGFVGLLLGSVSSGCVHHAPCPVVVVPPPHDGESTPA